MRAFIAVDISQQVISEIERIVARSRKQLPAAKWLAAAGLHLTLRFLGDSNESTLESLSEAVGSLCLSHPPFTLEFRGVGFFPSERRPRVFWVGVYEPPEVLLTLQRKMEAVAQEHGFHPERRKFSPHLTLARFRRPHPDPRFLQLVQELSQHPFGSSRVEEAVLYRSILRPEGAEYQVLKRFRLGLLKSTGTPNLV